VGHTILIEDELEGTRNTEEGLGTRNATSSREKGGGIVRNKDRQENWFFIHC